MAEYDINRVKDLIGANRLDEAISQLESITNNTFPTYHENVLQLKRRYHSLKNKETSGTISLSEFTLTENQIGASLLKLVSSIENEEAYIPENNQESNFWNRLWKWSSSKKVKRAGLIGLFSGAIIGGGTYINNGGIQNINDGDVYINPGADKHFVGAWKSVQEEIQQNVTACISLIVQLESDPPQPFWDVRKFNETDSQFQDRAREYFRTYQDNLQMYRRNFPVKERQYEVQSDNLSYESNVKLAVDNIYAHFSQINQHISSYQDELVKLQNQAFLSDEERIEKARFTHRLKLIDAKMALIDIIQDYYPITEKETRFWKGQFSLLPLPEHFPKGNLTMKDWSMIQANLAKSKSELFHSQTNQYVQAQQREIKRKINDPYLLFLRRMMGMSDSLSEGEWVALKNKELDVNEEDPIKLMQLAGLSFIECDAGATLFYLRQAAKATSLTPKQELYIQLSIDRIEHPDIYQGSLGVVVLEVEDGANLAESGVIEGDVIVAVDGEVIQEPLEIANYLGKANNKTSVFDIIRSGKAERISIDSNRSLGALMSQLVVLQTVRI